jgi:hypothetical protein
MLKTLSRHREPHVRPGPLGAAAAIDTADVDLLLRDVLVLARPVTASPDGTGEDIVDEWGMQSFPASDPPANW